MGILIKSIFLTSFIGLSLYAQDEILPHNNCQKNLDLDLTRRLIKKAEGTVWQAAHPSNSDAKLLALVLISTDPKAVRISALRELVIKNHTIEGSRELGLILPTVQTERHPHTVFYIPKTSGTPLTRLDALTLWPVFEQLIDIAIYLEKIGVDQNIFDPETVSVSENTGRPLVQMHVWRHDLTEIDQLTLPQLFHSMVSGKLKQGLMPDSIKILDMAEKEVFTDPSPRAWHEKFASLKAVYFKCLEREKEKKEAALAAQELANRLKQDPEFLANHIESHLNELSLTELVSLFDLQRESVLKFILKELKDQRTNLIVSGALAQALNVFWLESAGLAEPGGFVKIFAALYGVAGAAALPVHTGRAINDALYMYQLNSFERGSGYRLIERFLTKGGAQRTSVAEVLAVLKKVRVLKPMHKDQLLDLYIKHRDDSLASFTKAERRRLAKGFSGSSWWGRLVHKSITSYQKRIDALLNSD